MREAIAHIQIAPEQYRRPQRSAVAHGINRGLFVYYQQCILQHLSLAFSDLKSCYDRIVHSSARLALQRLGIPLPEIVSMLDMIKRMSHTVRMEYGYSNLTYG